MTDLTSPGSSVTLATVSGGNAIFQYDVPIGSGTGIYNTFLATQSTDGTAEGYNSNTGGNYLDTNSAKTESIQLSSLQTSVVGGVTYYIFRLDLNESPDIVQLNKLKVFVSPNQAAAGDFNNTTDTFANTSQVYTPIFDLDQTTDQTLILTEHSSGSGTDDYALLIPVDAFPASGYVTLYTNFGAPSKGNVNDPNAEDGGFDEWAAFSKPGTDDGAPAIQVVKTASVSSIDEGTATDITYTYELTNTGEATDPLTVTGLDDDILGDILADGTFVGGDTDNDGLLDTDETWTYQITAEDVVKNVGEDITNTVTATGTDDEGEEATDTDDETVTVTGAAPAIQVVKTASVGSIVEGTPTDITYTYELTNTGAATDPLTITGLDDDILGDILADGTFVGGDDGDGLLETGETWTYQITAEDVVKNVGEDITNTVTATGTDDEGEEATDTDDETVTVTGAAPAIQVVKTASVGSIVEGTPTDITYTYELTNTGAATDPLTITGLDDDILGDILADGTFVGGDDGDGLLETGETWTYQITAEDVVKNVGEDITNTVTATGTDDEGEEATDTDDETVTVTGAAPAIQVVKTASVGSIVEGTPTDITYTYELTNTGAATDPLTITGLDDDILGDILADGTFVGGDDGDGLLETGETWTYQITAEDVVKNVGEDITNTVTATGTDDEGEEATDTDDETVTVTGAAPAIQVVKTASVGSIVEGTPTDITYTYELTNTGAATDPLTITGLDDDILGDILADGTFVGGDDGDGLLETGETWTYQITAEDVVKNVGEDITNTVTATGTDDEGEEATDTDDETVTVTGVAASIAIVKTVDANGDNVFNDKETVQAGGDSVTYMYQVTNTSTANIDPLTLDDLVDDMGSFADVNLMVDGALQAGVTLVKSGGDQDSLLETGETWTFKYTTNVNIAGGQTLTNTATVSAVDDDGSTASASDTATVEAVAGPGVRTPGFWGNLGKMFWDGTAGNETKSGSNFASGELVYKVDSNNDGAKDNTAGLLIGDYNKDGITNNGEDTFFISLADAVKVINSSTKDQQDTRFVLARDAVATWLNYLAGNPIGDASDPNSPHKYLDQAIDWLQVTNGGNAGSSWENWGGGSAVKAGGGTIWNNASNTENATAGNELSGDTIHSELDFFNNTGMTFLGVNTFVYANDGG